MDSKKIIQIVVLFFVVSVLVFLALGIRSDASAEIGDPGFNFELEDVDGNIHSLSDYKGNVIVLNYFTSWCQPCIEEAPELEAFNKEYKDRATLLIIDRGETKGSVKKFIEENNSKITYLFDFNMDVSKRYRVAGQPETIIIDKDGIIRDRIIGVVSKDVLALKVSKYQ